MRYYWDTVVRCVPPEVVVESLCRAGFENVKRQRFGPVLTEYVGTRP
jgi:demethylmenaquinone methyltransferase/2-methoxy-6-polyprenyl-1,4-benzoquinol methylase